MLADGAARGVERACICADVIGTLFRLEDGRKPVEGVFYDGLPMVGLSVEVVLFLALLLFVLA